MNRLDKVIAQLENQADNVEFVFSEEEDAIEAAGRITDYLGKASIKDVYQKGNVVGMSRSFAMDIIDTLEIVLDDYGDTVDLGPMKDVLFTWSEW